MKILGYTNVQKTPPLIDFTWNNYVCRHQLEIKTPKYGSDGENIETLGKLGNIYSSAFLVAFHLLQGNMRICYENMQLILNYNYNSVYRNINEKKPRFSEPFYIDTFKK